MKIGGWALACVLAAANFADPLVAVPGAISATAHSCIGSLLAGAWRYRDNAAARPDAATA